MTRVLSFVTSLFIIISLTLSVPATDAAARGNGHGNGNPPSHSSVDKRHGKPRNTNPPKFSQSGGRDNPPTNTTPNPPPPAATTPAPHNPGPPPQTNNPKPPPRANNNKPKVNHGHPHVNRPRSGPPTRNPNPRRSETRTVAPEPVPSTQQRAKEAAKDKKNRSRQPRCSCGRMAPEKGWITLPPVTLSGPEAAGLGTLTIFMLMLLILFGMWIGYYMGYKDSDKADAKFLRSLLGK